MNDSAGSTHSHTLIQTWSGHRLMMFARRHRSASISIGVVLICLILELFVFNYAHWQSLGIGAENSTYTVGKGLRHQTDGSLLVTDTNTATLSFTPNSHVDNVRMPLADVSVPGKAFRDVSRPTTELTDIMRSNQNLHITITADEQGATVPWAFPERIVNSSVPSSQWITVHLSGVSHQLDIHIDESAGTVIKLNNRVTLNSLRPFIFNPLRIICYILILLFTAAFPLLRRTLTSQASHVENRSIWLATCAVALAIVLGAILAMRPWHALRQSAWPADFEYQWTARSILNGHAWIDYPVAPALRQMADPYDPWLRQQLLDSKGENYLFDFVLFNGKYYSYFGVLPCLLLFVPFRLLTHTDLSAWKANALLLVIVTIMAFLLVRLLFKRFAPKTPPLIQSQCALALSIISQPALYLSLTVQATYSVPIAATIALSYSAISLWLLASLQQSRFRFMVYTALGGFCAGLILGCRPQVCLIIFLAPVILSHRLNQVRRQGTRYPWITAAFATAIPFLFAAAPFLWWNHIRFGNLFDFGATYQLTTTDMRAPKDIVSKMPFAFLQSLLMPLGVQDQFPFFTATGFAGSSQGGYQGAYMAEPLLGGVLFWLPLGWLLFSAFSHRVRMHATNRTGVASLLYACLLLCAILLSIDATVTFLARYMSDWGFLFGIASVCVVIMLFNAITDETARRYLYAVIIVLITISVSLSAVAVLMNGRFNQLSNFDPALFTMARDTLAVFN